MNDKKKIDSNFNLLYNRYITGVASDRDIEQLEELANSSSVFGRQISDAQFVIDQVESLKLMRKVDTNSAYSRYSSLRIDSKMARGWLYYWQRAAAILLLPFLIFSGFQLWKLNKKEINEETIELGVNEVITTAGLRSNFILPDGTKVWLNGSSKIVYPFVFDGNKRQVMLQGEAFFEVAKDAEKPFIVNAGGLNVEALGTSFNCMAYPDDQFVETALTEGKIRVVKLLDGKEKGEYILDPGQAISYIEDTDEFYLHEGSLEKFISWRSGKFIFKNDPLEIVCRKLGRWFNAEVVIEDESLKNYAFTGTFPEEGLVEIIDLISLTSPIRYEVTERKVGDGNNYRTLKISIMKK